MKGTWENQTIGRWAMKQAVKIKIKILSDKSREQLHVAVSRRE